MVLKIIWKLAKNMFYYYYYFPSFKIYHRHTYECLCFNLLFLFFSDESLVNLPCKILSVR